MTTEQRIARRVRDEVGDWPTSGSSDADRVARIAIQEVVFSMTTGELPPTSHDPKRGCGVRVYHYGGYPQVVLESMGEPELPPKEKLVDKWARWLYHNGMLWASIVFALGLGMQLGLQLGRHVR